MSNLILMIIMTVGIPCAALIGIIIICISSGINAIIDNYKWKHR